MITYKDYKKTKTDPKMSQQPQMDFTSLIKYIIWYCLFVDMDFDLFSFYKSNERKS